MNRPRPVSGTSADLLIDRLAQARRQLRALIGCLPPRGCSALITHANSAGPARSRGLDLLARWHRGPWQATLAYTFVDASREQFADQREDVPLTPRHQAAVVAAWEGERTRIGWELYVVGEQPLEENPYRTVSTPYALTGVLVQHRIGPAQLFVNFENLTGSTRKYRVVVLGGYTLSGCLVAGVADLFALRERGTERAT